MSNTISAREAHIRRAFAHDGEQLVKSRVRNPHCDDRGGYMIVASHSNAVVAGARFDLTLEEIEADLAREQKAKMTDQREFETSAVFEDPQPDLSLTCN
jgi:hypothetical protein